MLIDIYCPATVNVAVDVVWLVLKQYRLSSLNTSISFSLFVNFQRVAGVYSSSLLTNQRTFVSCFKWAAIDSLFRLTSFTCSPCEQGDPQHHIESFYNKNNLKAIMRKRKSVDPLINWRKFWFNRLQYINFPELAKMKLKKYLETIRTEQHKNK